MNVDPRPLVLPLLVTALGVGCEQDSPNSRAGAEARPDEQVSSKIEVASDDAAPIIPVAESADRPGSPPVIGFPQLDEARTLDFIDPQLSFPEFLRKLDGRRVGLVGFMAPFDDLRDMRRCMFLPSYVGCKFCSPPSLTQVVFVTQGDADESGTRPYIDGACEVTGILRLSLPNSDHEGKRQGFIYSLEDAVVTPYVGDAPERTSVHENTPHQLRLPRLAPITMPDLVAEVADLLGRPPILPIEVEPLPAAEFRETIRSDLDVAFEEETRIDRNRAFQLLGLLPDEVDLLDVLEEFQRSLRVAATNDAGTRIHLLDSVPEDHPYVRLQLVGEIADALTRQHFPFQDISSPPDGDAGGFEPSDDTRRARDAVRQGLRIMTIYRYATARGIPAGSRRPERLAEETRDRRRGLGRIGEAIESDHLELWEGLPTMAGAFFINARVGDTGALSGLDPVLARPPSTTMEVFRPGWYADASQWRRTPVPGDFADQLMDAPPDLTDVLGAGGLVPLLTQWYSFEVAKSLVGGWAGDRWALWRLPDGASALLLETRWQDEESARRFHDAIPPESAWFLLPHRPGSDRVRLMRGDSADAIDRLTWAVLTATDQDEPVEASTGG